MNSYHHRYLRDKLLKEALKIVDEKGADYLNMRDLGITCGVSRSAAYRHFESKDYLLAELGVFSFEQLYQTIYLEIKKEKKDDIKSQLLASGVGYVVYLTKYANRQKLLFGNIIKDPNSASYVEKSGEKAFSLMASIIDKITASKEHAVKDKVSRYKSIGSWALVHGLVELINKKLINDLKSNDQKEISRYVKKILENTNFL